jgi:phosphomethylpyrimidine synthase
MLKESPTFSTIRTPSSYQASRERYLQGCRSDVRVRYREVTLSDTRHRDQTETNPFRSRFRHLWLYTNPDPDTAIRLTAGLPALRGDWIKEREDTEIFTLRSSSLGSIE